MKEVYTKLSHVECVVKLFGEESDGKFNYFAFQKFELNLAAFIRREQFPLEEENFESYDIGVLRYAKYFFILFFIYHLYILLIFCLLFLSRVIVRALMELHANFTFHCNLTPDSILIKQTADATVVVKFCGLLTSKSYTKDEFERDEDTKERLDVEKQNLGKIMWYYLSSGKYRFVKSHYQPGFISASSQSKKVGLKCPIAADVIQKLLYRNSSLSLYMVYRHVIFWGADVRINFIRTMSD